MKSEKNEERKFTYFLKCSNNVLICVHSQHTDCGIACLDITFKSIILLSYMGKPFEIAL